MNEKSHTPLNSPENFLTTKTIFSHKPITSQPLEMKLSIKLNKLEDTCRIFGDTSTPYLAFWCYDWWN